MPYRVHLRAENLHLQVTLLNSCIVNKEDVFFSFLEKKNAARKVLLAGIRDGLEGEVGGLCRIFFKLTAA